MPILPPSPGAGIQPDGFDARRDVEGSFAEAYRAIRERIAAGGPGWEFAGLPRNHYQAIVADPPWRFKSYTALQVENWNSRRDVEKHYRVLDLAAIAALPVGKLAAKDCHLFLWVTGPCLPWGLEVMKAWGFRYSAMAFVWIKLRRRYEVRQLRVVPFADADLHVGLGLTTRKNAEFMLLGRRGNCRRLAKDVREVILAPVREHSRKPDEAYARVERYCAGPYLELFARQRRPGWDCWGDEVGGPRNERRQGNAVDTASTRHGPGRL